MTSSLPVHESVQAELLDILCERTAAIRIGDPLLPDTLLGYVNTKKEGVRARVRAKTSGDTVAHTVHEHEQNLCNLRCKQCHPSVSSAVGDVGFWYPIYADNRPMSLDRCAYPKADGV